MKLIIPEKKKVRRNIGKVITSLKFKSGSINLTPEKEKKKYKIQEL